MPHRMMKNVYDPYVLSEVEYFSRCDIQHYHYEKKRPLVSKKPKCCRPSHFSRIYGACLGPVGPRWAPCWPHESCYQGYLSPIMTYMTQSHRWVNVMVPDSLVPIWRQAASKEHDGIVGACQQWANVRIFQIFERDNTYGGGRTVQ